MASRKARLVPRTTRTLSSPSSCSIVLLRSFDMIPLSLSIPFYLLEFFFLIYLKTIKISSSICYGDANVTAALIWKRSICSNSFKCFIYFSVIIYFWWSMQTVRLMNPPRFSELSLWGPIGPARIVPAFSLNGPMVEAQAFDWVGLA